MNQSFPTRISALAVKVILATAFFIGVMHEATSQTASDSLNIDDGTVTTVEEPPEYPGGFAEMMTFVKKEMNYPKAAERRKGQGTVYVEFIIEEDGRVAEVKTIKGVHEECDAEAERIVRLMPNWKPGKIGGKPVRVRFVLPIKFGSKTEWTKGS